MRRELLLAGMALPLAGGGTKQLSSPAGADSKWPSLTVADEGLALSWVEQKADGAKAFRFAQFNGKAWGAAKTIAAGPQLMLNWADFPTIVSLGDGRFAAHWLERPEGAKGAYGIRVAFTKDDGATWKTSFASTRPKTEGYEGFVSFSKGTKQLLASFLDHSEPVTKLRLARFEFDGRFVGEEVVDNDVCSCCQTTLVHAAGTPVVSYRNHEAGEIRDNSVARYVNGKWVLQGPVHRDGWKINACPVNGPAFASRGKIVGASWFTAANGAAAVKAAISWDGGATFRQPQELDTGKPLGRVDCAMYESGMIVAWLGRKAELAEFRLAYIEATGEVKAGQVIESVNPARSSGFPRLAVANGRCYVAWTGETGVRIASLG